MIVVNIFFIDDVLVLIVKLIMVESVGRDF